MINLLRDVWHDRDTPVRAKRIKTLRDQLIARLGYRKSHLHRTQVQVSRAMFDVNCDVNPPRDDWRGARVVTDESNRRVYARDLADIPNFIERALFRTTPLIVVQPRSTQEVASVLRLANEENVVVFPRGVASSAFGGPVPTTNGIVLDLSPMQKIDPPSPPRQSSRGRASSSGGIRFDSGPEDADDDTCTARKCRCARGSPGALDSVNARDAWRPIPLLHEREKKEGVRVTVDAGARWGDVDDFLSRFDLQLYTYPSNRFATVAGWIASGGYGMNGYKYGHVSKHVAALELVTPRGDIKTIRDTDADFGKYFATEGLMGVITRVTLRVRTKPQVAVPHLLYFEADADAFRFAQALAARGIVPASVKFFDARLLHLLNEHQRREPPPPLPLGEGERAHLLQEKPALLIFTDDAETEMQFSQFLNEQMTHSPIAESPNYIAGHIWADRYFPMKIRSLGPSLLAAQVILPLDTVADFLAHARRLALRFGLAPATECHVIATPTGIRVLAMPMFLTDQSKFSYSIHLAFVSLLDRVGAKYDGQPYNLGIWHAPFAAERYDAKTLRELRAFKRAQDPRNILNPHKFFRVRSRFFGIPGLLFHPFIFKLGMDALDYASRIAYALQTRPTTRPPNLPIIRPLKSSRASSSSSALGSPPRDDLRPSDVALPQLQLGVPAAYDLQALARTATECTSCGACVSICPAYVHTKDERVTGRAKLWLARKLANGEEIAQTEADAAWLCVRCRACAEVCQAQLPLMAAYEKFEEELEKKFGRPNALIQDFIEGMERNPEYRAKVGLTLPIELTEQRWTRVSRQPSAASSHTSPITASSHIVLESDESFDLPEPGGKYHISVKPALPRHLPLGKFAIDRNDQCISCGQCVEACVYGVHFRNPLDIRRMNEPKDELCRACFRCIQECPRGALTISFDADYARAGRGAFTADVMASLQRQADEGKIPVLGAGYRGPFAGRAFDSMWTDMSEIVRPTRDGIHGREYISTAVDLGRRPLKLDFGNGQAQLPRFLEIPIPFLFNQLSIHRTRNVLLAMARAARQLGTYAMVSRADWFDELTPYLRHIALAVTANDLGEFVARFPLIEIADAALLPRVQALAPNAITMLRVDEKHLDIERIVELAREGAEIIHLAFDPVDQAALFDELPRVHARLVEKGLRDAVTLIASGAIAMAEHMPKTIILGADAVAIDLPLVVALECVLDERCFTDTSPSVIASPEGAKQSHPSRSLPLARGGHGVGSEIACFGFAQHRILRLGGVYPRQGSRGLRPERSEGLHSGSLLAMTQRKCTRGIETIDPAWGEQRIVNLAASWRNQLLEVLGAMGLREVRRLRGERGRAMFKEELDEKLFASIFAK